MKRRFGTRYCRFDTSHASVKLYADASWCNSPEHASIMEREPVKLVLLDSQYGAASQQTV